MKNVMGLAIEAVMILCGIGLAQDTIWTRRYDCGRPGWTDRAAGAAVCPTGELVVVDCPWHEETGESTYYMVFKYSPAGDTVWTRTRKYASAEVDGLAVAVDADGNIAVVGCYYIRTQSYMVAEVTKYDRAGTLLWTRRAEASEAAKLTEVVIDDSMNIIASGHCFGPGPHMDALLLKYSPAGDLRWCKTLDFGGDYVESVDGLTLDRTGCIVGVGISGDAYLTNDHLLVKFSPDGDTVWSRLLNLTEQGYECMFSVACDSSGDLVACGWDRHGSGSDAPVRARVVKFTTAGDTLWTRMYQGEHGASAADLALDSAGNVLVTGVLYRPDERPSCLLSQYTPEGTLVWSHTYQLDAYNLGLNVDLSGPNTIYITGIVSDSLVSGYDVFVMKLDYTQGIAEAPPDLVLRPAPATLALGTLRLPRTSAAAGQALFSLSGRKVLDLQPGENDIRHVAPGVYFVREGPRIEPSDGTCEDAEQGSEGPSVRRVVIQR